MGFWRCHRSSVHAGGVLLFGKMVMACPKQIADILVRRGILAAAKVVPWMEGVGVVVWRGFC